MPNPQSHIWIGRDWSISGASETWGPGPSCGDRQCMKRTWCWGNPAFPKREQDPGVGSVPGVCEFMSFIY